jgi:UDP-N-acetyl-D-glucosamine dehydrogenase
MVGGSVDRPTSGGGHDRLVVIGLGYVGLPLALGATRVGITVTGLDTSATTVDSLNSGRSHVDDVSDAEIASMLDAGFTATTDASCITEADVIVICVPTPLSPEFGPNLEAVESAARATAAHLRPGQLVVLESTTYPGTTEEVLVPILETSGLRVGVEFNCAFSPERIDPGNATYTLQNTPKVVGGMTPACTARATDFYSAVVDSVVVAKGVREAEMTKLLENTYRHVNIALVNEMARFCSELDIDLWDAIRCASTKPFGFNAFYPGPGVGGHCIPIDPNYLSHRVRTHLGYSFRFVELAQEINYGMPAYVARRVQDLLNDQGLAARGSRVLLLGVTYKADIADQRESPSVDVAHALKALGAHVSYHDPYVPEWHLNGESLARVADLEQAMADVDVIVLLQAHSVYDRERLGRVDRPLLDTRGVLVGQQVSRL